MANQLGGEPGGVQLGTTPGSSKPGTGSIVTSMLADGSVTTAKLALSSVTNAKLDNAGSASGRLGVPVLIDQTTLTAATSYLVNLPATYRSLKIISRVSGGMSAGNPISLTLNADSAANYYRIAEYAQGSAAQAANAGSGEAAAVLCLSGAASMQETDFELEIHSRKITSRFMPFFCRWYSISGVGPTTDIAGKTHGIWNNNGADVTSVRINYGVASTGSIEVWGVPT